MQRSLTKTHAKTYCFLFISICKSKSTKNVYSSKLNFIKFHITVNCQRQVLKSWNYNLLISYSHNLKSTGSMTVICPAGSTTVISCLGYSKLEGTLNPESLSYHDIMPLHLCLLTGKFLTFQLQAVQDIRKSKYADLDLHPSPLNHHVQNAKLSVLNTILITEEEAEEKGDGNQARTALSNGMGKERDRGFIY